MRQVIMENRILDFLPENVSNHRKWRLSIYRAIILETDDETSLFHVGLGHISRY